MAPNRRASPFAPDPGRRLQWVRQQNTSVEFALQSELHACDLRCGVEVPTLAKPRRVADFALSGFRDAVFVDGWFRDGCPEHVSWSNAKADFFRSKRLATEERELDTGRRLRGYGWVVVRSCAHEAPYNIASCVVRVIRSRRRTEKSR
jgi:G:T-mismatch repair DNA endonuclease (very short patch repair protein)